MTYTQHRNHVSDGIAPVEACYWCFRFIVQPASRAQRGHLKPTENDCEPVNLDEYDELAAQEAA